MMATMQYNHLKNVWRIPKNEKLMLKKSRQPLGLKDCEEPFVILKL